MKSVLLRIDLSIVSGEAPAMIATGEFDRCSVQAIADGASTFGGGVIAVRKANKDDWAPVDFSTPVTITGPGWTLLDPADWSAAAFLAFQVTTAAAGISARLMVHLKRLGYKP